MAAERPAVLRLAGPLIISFWLRQAFSWVDMAYATALEGAEDASIAAIGLAGPFEFMLIACWVGMSNGLTSRLSAAMGARRGEEIEQLKRATNLVALVLMFLFLAVAAGIWFLTPLLDLDATVSQQFRVYGSVLIGGMGFTAFWSILPDSLVKAHHDTRSTMWAGLYSSFANVALNSLFVFVFHWGIFGIAFSTVLSRLAGLFYAQARAARHERARVEAWTDAVPGRLARPIGSIMTIAVPAAITFLLIAAEGFAVNGILVRSENQEANLAAWSIFDRAVRFMTMPPIAIGVAMLPLAAKLYGTGDFAAIRREVRVALLASVVYGLLIVVPTSLWAWGWVSEALAESDAAQRAAEAGRLYIPVAVLLSSPLFILRSTFEGLQRPRPGLVTAFVRTALVIVLIVAGIALLDARGGDTIHGVYAGFTAGLGISSAILYVWIDRALKHCAQS